MATYSIGISSTEVELENSFGLNKVSVTPSQDMFINLNNLPVRKVAFSGTVDSDATKVGDSLSLRRTIETSDVSGPEIRVGEILSFYDAGSTPKCIAKVLSVGFQKIVVDLLEDVDIVLSDTYTTSVDTLLKADKTVHVESSNSKKISLATSAAATANNLVIVAVNNNGSLIRG